MSPWSPPQAGVTESVARIHARTPGRGKKIPCISRARKHGCRCRTGLSHSVSVMLCVDSIRLITWRSLSRMRWVEWSPGAGVVVALRVESRNAMRRVEALEGPCQSLHLAATSHGQLACCRAWAAGEQCAMLSSCGGHCNWGNER